MCYCVSASEFERTFCVKATCKLHKRCACWVNRGDRNLDVLRHDLVEWLSRGEPVEGDGPRLAHQIHADGLKVSYGMRIRRT